MTESSHAKTTRLRHGLEYCFGLNCYSTPDEAEEIRCRCGRKWRGVDGRWKLVVISAAFDSEFAVSEV